MLEILGKIGFDWQVALANLINFVIIFIILNYLVFKPLNKVISKRQEKINEGLENADKAQAALVQANSQKEELLKDAYGESQNIVSEAKNKKEAIIGEAKGEAEEEASKIRENAVRDAERIKKQGEEDLEDEAASMVLDGMEKVLKEGMNKSMNEKYIKSVLSKK